MNIRKLRVESLEERALLAVVAGGVEEVAISPAPTGGTIWVVNTVEDPTEWDTSDDILSLREAISCAVDGDTIKFDPILSEGWIILNGNQLVISEAITIDASETGGMTLDANVKNRVLSVSGGTSENPVTLVGLNIVAGNSNSDGGGIYNAGVLKLVRCSVKGNTTTKLGGGIANNKTLDLIDCTVQGNYNYGIRNSSNSSILNLDNCSVTNNSGLGIAGSGTVKLLNTTVSWNAGYGIDGFGSLTLTGCSITHNSNYGIRLNTANATLTSCVVSDNSGGITCSCSASDSDAVTVSLSGCKIRSNTSSSYGAGIYNNGYKYLTLTNCTISKNTSQSNGGGVYNSGTMSFVNCVIADNTCINCGGGIYSNGTLRLTNCTVVKNNAKGQYGNTSGSGGGIYKKGVSYLFNSIVLLNVATTGNGATTTGNNIHNATDSLYLYNSIYNSMTRDTGWSFSSNCYDYDSSLPLFVSAGNYDLPEGSQAVNKGSNSYIINYSTDIVGNERISGGIVDIGAYEYQFTEPVVELDAPLILTGNQGVYVSAGANRHQITWTAVENASAYELTYTSNSRDDWTSVITAETSAVITGLTYGDEVSYRVRALDAGSFSDSVWSEGKTFVVCPMDINGDGDIGGADRGVLAYCWLAEEGDDDYIPAADIDGNGDVGGTDRAYLANNWLNEVGTDDMIYPRPLAADIVFSEFASADLDADLNVF